jgi:hypothetical protein
MARPRNELQDMIKVACRLTHALRVLPSSETDASIQSAKGVLQRCMEALFYLEQATCSLGMTARVSRSLSSNAPPYVAQDPQDGGGSSSRAGHNNEDDVALAPGVARFVGVDGDAKISQTQQLILYMLNVVYSKGYSRHGGDCYERLPSPGGFDTRAWRRACSIKDLIYDATRKEIKFDQWLNLTQNKSNAQTVVDYMVNCCDSQFPVVVKDRRVFAFSNGIYLTTSAALCLDREMERAKDARVRREELRDVFVTYGSQAYCDLPPGLSACNYFDSEFPVEQRDAASGGDWYHSVATPHLQSIFAFQMFDEEVCRWAYAFMGRLLYELNDYDSWQVVPYLKGQASSGKSTIVNTCRDMYDFCDVGVLSNNIERKFGIAAFCDKYMFVAPEIKADLQLEQAEFQSMVSGESLQLAVKFQQAHTIDWKVPGIMAGNEVPGWVDNSGSIGRRIIVFEFLRKVIDGDMELKHKLRQEMPSILLKCNRAYHWAVTKCGSDNVWAHLPDYFKNTKADLTESTNPIQHFMNSGKLSFSDPEAYMPMDVLKRAFQAHCNENNFKSIRLTKDKFVPVMFEFGLVLEAKRQATTRAYPRPATGDTSPATFVTHKEWCLGADLVPSSASAGNNISAQGVGNVFDDPMLV